MKPFVIDAHSHVGKDIFHGNSEIDKYITFAKKSGIDVALIMGVPSPCTNLHDINSRTMYWKYSNNKMNYYGEQNPYLKINYNLNELLKKRSSKDLQLLFIQMFHPILDDINQFRKMIEITDPVALKIHGIGSGIGPDDINTEFIKIIKKYELPITVHTDCDFGEGSIAMNYIRNKNCAKEWAKFFLKNEIFGVLNHGASLDKETFNMVNKSELLKVAIGPDRVACIDKNRLYVDCLQNYKNYLFYIKENLDISKIIYDADYNWNQIDNDSEDYESVQRILEVFPKINEYEKVLSKNILNQYPKLKNKIVRSV